MAGKLAKLGIITIFDLLYHLPFRYEDRRQISLAKSVQIGETVTLVGHISAVKNIFTKNGKRLQEAVFTDSSGSLSVIWFGRACMSLHCARYSRAWERYLGRYRETTHPYLRDDGSFGYGRSQDVLGP